MFSIFLDNCNRISNHSFEEFGTLLEVKNYDIYFNNEDDWEQNALNIRKSLSYILFLDSTEITNNNVLINLGYAQATGIPIIIYSPCDIDINYLLGNFNTYKRYYTYDSLLKNILELDIDININKIRGYVNDFNIRNKNRNLIKIKKLITQLSKNGKSFLNFKLNPNDSNIDYYCSQLKDFKIENKNNSLYITW